MRQCYWYIKISKNTPIEIDDDNDCDNLLLVSCMWFCIAVCNSPSKPVSFELDDTEPILMFTVAVIARQVTLRMFQMLFLPCFMCLS